MWNLFRAKAPFSEMVKKTLNKVSTLEGSIMNLPFVELDNATAIRYDVPDRTMRKFNTTGREKNPLRVEFWARNEKTADNYKDVYDIDGFNLSELNKDNPNFQTTRTDGKISGKFLNLPEGYKKTKAYKDLENEWKRAYFRDAMSESMSKVGNTKKNQQSASKLFHSNMANLDKDISYNMLADDYASLSNFDRQNILAEELKDNGFDGYVTENEIAVFPWSKDYGISFKSK